MAKFLDLEIFEKKFRLAKEDASDMKGALKRLEGREYQEEIKALNTNLARRETRLSVKKRECEALNSELDAIKAEYKDLEEKISSIPAEVINIEKVTNQLQALDKASIETNKQNDDLLKELKIHNDLYKKLENFIDSFDKEEFKSKIDMGGVYQKQIDEIHNQIKVSEMKHENHKKKINILNQVPCGDKYPQCHFIKDAHIAKNNISHIVLGLDDLRVSKDNINKGLTGLEIQKANEYLDKFDKVYQKKLDCQQDISKNNLKLEKNKTLSLRMNTKKAELELEKQEYESNSVLSRRH